MHFIFCFFEILQFIVYFLMKSSSAFAEVPVVPVGQFQFIFPGSRGMHTAKSGTLLKCLPKLCSSNNVICFGNTFPLPELVTAAAAALEGFWQNPSAGFAQDFESMASRKPRSSSSICWPFISVETLNFSLIPCIYGTFNFFSPIPHLQVISQILSWCNLAGFIDSNG